MNKNLQSVPFCGTSLLSFQENNIIYVAMRPIVEALDLSWGTQLAKLNKNKEKFNCFDIETVAQDGKSRVMLCLSLKKLNGWLFSINPAKVREDLREKVTQYQEECFQVLHDYWTKSAAVNPRRSTVAERKGLREAAASLVHQSHLAYADVFRMVHQRFQVESIEDLSPEQIHQAIHYLHSLTLQPQAEALPPREYFMILAKMTAFAQEYLDLTRMMRKNDSNREQFNLAYDGWTACTPEDERQHGYVVFLNGNLKDDIQRAQNFLRQQSALLIGV